MITTPSLAQLLKQAIDNRLLDVHTALIGRVKKYDSKTQLAEVQLTATSGLKGTPEISSGKTVNIQAVLMPELLPGKTIHIESTRFNGFVSVQSVQFLGSNFRNEWGCQMVCSL